MNDDLPQAGKWMPPTYIRLEPANVRECSGMCACVCCFEIVQVHTKCKFEIETERTHSSL